MKILIIGGTGHIGSYLVPRLLSNGFDISVISRECSPRYIVFEDEWRRVKWIRADRTKEEADGSWKRRMESIQADVVVDLICFTPEQNMLMVNAFKGRISHFLHCGTLWAYGPAYTAPYSEDMPRRPITEYGRLKAMIEADLHDAHTRAGFPATVIHPGHISGRGWLPVDPQGTLDGTGVYSRLTHGEPVYLPDNGLATLHHVHADDVAQMFELAILNRGQSSGESFSSAAPAALTLLGCCNSVASLFGRDPNVEFVPLVELESIMSPGVYKETKTHVEHSPCASIQKAIERLGYRPRYTIPQIYRECVEEMIITGKLADKDFSGH